ncbi:MAG: Mpo1-like protein [Candidatus Acidiferrales bacterium]
MPMTEKPQSFAEFWPVYVRAHRHPGTRALHFVGTLAGWSLLVAAVATRTWWLVLVALAVGYAFAWIGHFFVEHNKPATFGHPGWSWLADQKMVGMMLLGRMGDEVRRAASSRGAEG